MEKEQLVSPFKNNVVAKKHRVILTNLLNYFLTFIGTYFLVVIAANPIATNLPVSNDIKASINANSKELYKIVGETHIQTYDETVGTLISIDSMKTAYLTTLVKTSYYINDTKYLEQDVKKEDTFLNNVNYPNDNLSYYYLLYKTAAGHEELSSYIIDGVDYKDDKITYQYEKIMGYSSLSYDGYFISKENYNLLKEEFKIIPRYEILNLDYAKYLANYLAYKTSGGIEESVWSNIGAAYLNGSNYARNEVETKYTPYITVATKINDDIKAYTVVYIVAAVLAYTLAFGILYVLVPLVNKKHKYESVGFLIMKEGYSTREELEPTWVNYLINCISRYIIGFSCIFLCFIFNGLYELTSINFGYFSFFGLLMGCLAYGLLSNLFVLFNKNHQDFASFTSLLLIKDKNEFEGPIEDVQEKEQRKDKRK